MEQCPPDTVEDADNALVPEAGATLSDELTNEADIESVADKSVADNGVASPPVPAHSRFGHLLRGAVRAFFVLFLSQYVITTLLVILAAIIIANQASDILVGKFDALARAIRQF